MKKRRIVIAIMFMAIGAAGLIFWEIIGRDYVMYDPVLVLSDDVVQGEILKEEKVRVKKVAKDNIIKGALKEKDKNKIIGKTSKQLLVKNSQMNIKYFSAEDGHIEKDESIYKIKGEWIGNCSASVRKGDRVDIYSDDGSHLGLYRVAFVKDEQGREIESIKKQNEEVLERTAATGVINSIEIIAKKENYEAIKRAVILADNKNEEAKLLTIVQKF